MKQDKKYSITLLEYTRIQEFPNSWLYAGHYLYEGYSSITYTICVLKSGDDVILIDTGYDMNKPESRAFSEAQKHVDYQSPAEMLEKIGLCAADIKHIILTHAHWDHMGALNLFPNAKIYIQKEEVLNWISTLAMPNEYATVKHPVVCQDMEECIGLLKDDRLVLLDGEVEDLFPGIDIFTARYGHSFASNVIAINTEKGKFVHVGDVAYVKKNITGANDDGVSLPNAYAVGGTLDIIMSLQKILKLVDGDVDRIILTHEMGIWDQCKSVQTEDTLHIGYITE